MGIKKRYSYLFFISMFFCLSAQIVSLLASSLLVVSKIPQKGQSVLLLHGNNTSTFDVFDIENGKGTISKERIEQTLRKKIGSNFIVTSMYYDSAVDAYIVFVDFKKLRSPNFFWIPLHEFEYRAVVKDDGSIVFPEKTKNGSKEFFFKGGQECWRRLVHSFFTNKSSWEILWKSPKKDARKRGAWAPIKHAVYFYDSNDPYYEFTNFAYRCPCPAVIAGKNKNYDNAIAGKKSEKLNLVLDGKQWKTTEHYFQAQKFVDPKTKKPFKITVGNKVVIPYDVVAREKTPAGAFRVGQQYGNYKRKDWLSGAADKAMMKAIRVKFSDENPCFKHVLLSTGERIIVENAGAKDGFWGAGQDYRGTNKLGQMLMIRRAELRKQRSEKRFVSRRPAYYLQKKHKEKKMIVSF